MSASFSPQTLPSADAIAKIAATIDASGYAVLPDYVKSAQLASLRHFLKNMAQDGQYLSFSGQPAGTIVGELANMPAFRALLHGLYELASRRQAPNQGLYSVFRTLAGNCGPNHSYRFHYDSYLVTALLPVIIPNDAGALLLLPNARKLRSHYLFNLLDKIALDNRASQLLLRTAALHGLLLKRITLSVGHLYLFWGYRSIHTNEPCPPGRIRATALWHFGDPHANSRLRLLTGQAKNRASSF